jgi:hypothetical protein
MKSTSSALSSTGFGVYRGSAIRNIIERVLPVNPRSLSGYTYGSPRECRYDQAATVGTFAMRRFAWRSRFSGSSTSIASG